MTIFTAECVGCKKLVASWQKGVKIIIHKYDTKKVYCPKCAKEITKKR